MLLKGFARNLMSASSWAKTWDTPHVVLATSRRVRPICAGPLTSTDVLSLLALDVHILGRSKTVDEVWVNIVHKHTAGIGACATLACRAKPRERNSSVKRCLRHLFVTWNLGLNSRQRSVHGPTSF